MDNNLKRTIILEHYAHPFNKGLIDDKSYMMTNVNNESCIDNINIMLKLKDDVIEDLRFDGDACAISTSATSIVVKILLYKTVDEALKFIEEYEKMIDEQEYDPNILGEAIVYDEIYKQPNRKKCALLPIRGIKRLLTQYNKGV